MSERSWPGTPGAPGLFAASSTASAKPGFERA
jgi:hypothetical protein